MQVLGQGRVKQPLTAHPTAGRDLGEICSCLLAPCPALVGSHNWMHCFLPNFFLDT